MVGIWTIDVVSGVLSIKVDCITSVLFSEKKSVIFCDIIVEIFSVILIMFNSVLVSMVLPSIEVVSILLSLFNSEKSILSLSFKVSLLTSSF